MDETLQEYLDIKLDTIDKEKYLHWFLCRFMENLVYGEGPIAEPFPYFITDQCGNIPKEQESVMHDKWPF